jgi:hypothetical protein
MMGTTRSLNRMPSIKRVQKTITEFAAPDLIESARQEAGVDDASVLDSSGLLALCQSLNSVSNQLRLSGRRRAWKMLLETLVKRLRLEFYLQREPEIREIPLAAPIFLIAPFRTGSTLLHRLLAQDPANRTPRLWETMQAPPAEPLYRGDERYFELDYRVAIARRYMEARALFASDIAAIHPSDVDLPEECFGLLETSMMSHSFMFHAPVTGYLDWLDERTDREWKAAYSVYADQLRMLQWWWPGERWVCKSGFHLWSLDALCETFPDAVIVQQHRSPVQCMASFCSLMEMAYRPILKRVDCKQIGQLALRYMDRALNRNAAARDRLGPGQFIDIDFDELVASPVACAQRVYGAAGLKLHNAVQRRMKDWLAAQSKVAKHDYELEKYGLSEHQVEAAFSSYSSLKQSASRE